MFFHLHQGSATCNLWAAGFNPGYTIYMITTKDSCFYLAIPFFSTLQLSGKKKHLLKKHILLQKQKQKKFSVSFTKSQIVSYVAKIHCCEKKKKQL